MFVFLKLRVSNLRGKGLGCDAFFCLECDAESFSQL